MKSRLFLDVHAIQTVPPANINRDDTGSPKTAQYGGVTRARVSSQSWKNAIRKYFKENNVELGDRTIRLVEDIANEVIKIDTTINYEDALKLAKELVKEAKFKKGSKYEYLFEVNDELKIDALFFVSRKQLRGLANLAIEKNYDIKEIRKILNENLSVDIALFGRMLAKDSSIDVDASSQVAQSISTHEIESEFDFYVGADDLNKKDKVKGAAMLGTIEYNSSTLYRYANIAMHDFCKQLGDKESAINAAKLFVEAFIKSMPTGKINSFANQTLPSAIVVTLRSDRPVNMVSAFEEPVKSNEGYVKKSVQKLFDEYSLYDNMLEKPVYTAYYTFKDYEVANIGKKENSIEDLVKDLGSELNSALDKIK